MRDEAGWAGLECPSLLRCPAHGAGSGPCCRASSIPGARVGAAGAKASLIFCYHLPALCRGGLGPGRMSKAFAVLRRHELLTWGLSQGSASSAAARARGWARGLGLVAICWDREVAWPPDLVQGRQSSLRGLEAGPCCCSSSKNSSVKAS